MGNDENNGGKYETPSGGNPFSGFMKEKKPVEFYFKMAVVVGGSVIIFAIILGSYLWNLTFNPENFQLVPWLEKIIFCTVISYVMMVLGFVDLDATLRASKNSSYSKDREAFNNDVGELYENNTVVYFDQFIPWEAERELKDKKIRFLTSRGISTTDAETLIEYASEDDLPIISGINPGDKPTGKFGEDLVKTVKVKGKDGKEIEKKVVIPKIKDINASYVQCVLDGEVTIDCEDPSYYLTDSKTRDTGSTRIERAQHAEKERRRYVVRQFITKGVSMVVISLIFTILTPDIADAGDMSERTWTFMLRLASAFGGFGAGAFAGVQNIAYITRWIDDKHKVVVDFTKYMESGLFVPKTREQLDKEKIEEYERAEKERKEREEKEKQEAINSVVIPEVHQPEIELLGDGGTTTK